MLPFASLPSRARTVRLLKFTTIVVLGGCSDQCDDPTGPDVQGQVLGQFTLNGEPIPGVVVDTDGRRSTTNANGLFNITVQGETLPIVGCLDVLTDPWATVASTVLFTDLCYALREDNASAEVDYAYGHDLPELLITAPADGAGVGTTPAVEGTLESHVSLNGSSVILPPAVRLTSSIDGEVGRASPLPGGSPGYNFSVDPTLSVGTHTLTATYTDLFDAVASAQITVTVAEGSNEPPTATITSPEGGRAYPGGIALDFAGTGEDPEDGTLSGSALAWTSSREGAIGTGASFSRVMAEGSHFIFLTATDSQGASAADTIAIHISATSGSGTILGTVSVGGTPLTEVPVTVTGPVTRETVTDGTGNYVFEGLPAGSYTITITPPAGTDITTEQNVTLGDGASLTVNFTG